MDEEHGMAIRITIGSETRDIEDADAAWITQQINRRRNDGQLVCVQVKFNEPSLNLCLATPTCGGGPGGRAPYPHEREILDLWHELRLDTRDFSAGNVVAFVKQITHMFSATH